MRLHNETPHLTGSNVRNGASVVRKVGQLQNYQNQTFSAMEIAARLLAARHGLPLHVARLVCELAHLGGRSV
jgi:hypothetical protein